MVRLGGEKEIGARIGEAREIAGLSQGDLASLISIARPAMNKIETGHEQDRERRTSGDGL